MPSLYYPLTTLPSRFLQAGCLEHHLPAQQYENWRIVKTQEPTYVETKLIELHGAVYTQWMTDSWAEIRDTKRRLPEIKGDSVLIGGLGLGLLPNILKEIHPAMTITIIELNEPVIRMVEPYIPSDVKVLFGDFLDVLPLLAKHGSHYDSIVVDMLADYQTYLTIPEPPQFWLDCKHLVERLYPHANHILAGGWNV